jgi:hypothetical protein
MIKKCATFCAEVGIAINKKDGDGDLRFRHFHRIISNVLPLLDAC